MDDRENGAGKVCPLCAGDENRRPAGADDVRGGGLGGSATPNPGAAAVAVAGCAAAADGGASSEPDRVKSAATSATASRTSGGGASGGGGDRSGGYEGAGSAGAPRRDYGATGGDGDRECATEAALGALETRDWTLPQSRPDRSGEVVPLVHMQLEMSIGQSSRSSMEGSVRNDETIFKDDKAAHDADRYLAMGVLARAFPERFCALIVTLLVEIPTLFIISGGSDQLCMLIGRRRYQLLIAFLPLTSAISGNVGLQASTLTTRAVSHMHVTRDHFWSWLWMEIGAACFLGLSMGAALGVFAYHTSGSDPALGITIFVAQFVSILTAGFTGTFAPLLFTFVFRRDSGQWGGPLETAIQDIIGSFAMIVLSYHTLMMFGPSEVDPDDRCGG